MRELKKYLRAWKFDDFYFDNVCKCEFLNKQLPTKNDADNCKGFLDAQIDVIQPKRLLLFGGKVMDLLGLSHSNVKYRGIPFTRVQHFSYPLYINRIDLYYENLKKILLEEK
jgi:uracil-DNA glycosylase family 4